jgi:hypothetical protein
MDHSKTFLAIPYDLQITSRDYLSLRSRKFKIRSIGRHVWFRGPTKSWQLHARQVNLELVKVFLLVTVFTCGCVSAFGQGGFRGRVIDGTQNLRWVTVVLLSEDSAFISGAVTDSLGQFSFVPVKAGRYRITASMIGYTKYSSDIIANVGEKMQVPDITLEEASTHLNEVMIQESKQPIEQKIDRLVINLGSHITTSGNSVLEVLQKSPGVIVNRQSNTIAINGRAGVTVMVNNKPLQVPLEVVLQMLDGMNASNVEKIELITSPPSEFDAEGKGGVINVVTKQQEGLGTSGSFGLVAGARWAEAFGGNLNISHRNKRFAVSADYSITTNHNLHIFTSESRSFNDNFTRDVHGYSRRENFTVQQNLNVGLEWKLNSKSSMNVLFTGYRRNWNLDARTDDVNQSNADSMVVTAMVLEEKNVWQSAAGSIGFQRKIDTKSEVSLTVDYLYYFNDNPSSYNNTVSHQKLGDQEQSTIELGKTTPIRFLVAKTDYKYELTPSLYLEAGVKGVASTLQNNVHAQRNENDQWTTDPLFTSFSTLSERIYAAYLSTKWQPGQQWQINGGLRFEYTQTAISTPTERNLLSRKYGYLFPTLSAKKSFGDERDIQFSYAKRISRPTYNDIAPYVFFWGPRTFSAGNTALYPSIADAFSMGYHIRNIVISGQYSHARKEIVMMQPEVDIEHGTLTYRSQNLKYMRTVALTGSYTFPVTLWWEVQANATGQFQTVTTEHLINNLTRRRYGISLNVSNQFKLPKNFSIEVSGSYQSKALLGLSEFLPTGSLNVGVQKNLGQKGLVRLAVDDILNTNNWRINTTLTNELSSYFNYKWHNRFVRISYTRNLGKGSLRSVKVRSGSEEERSRVAN